MAAWREGTQWVVGIDEVGRGALAGPVTVAAVMLATDVRGRVKNTPFRKLKDSKKLSVPRREFWAGELRRHPQARFAIARVYPRGIERSNISVAANRAALSALLRLLKKYKFPPQTPVFLDGGLYLGSKTRQQKPSAACGAAKINAKTVIKADERIPAVAAASIIAKVSRDAYMRRLAKRYPQYGFDVHKGYGTAAHLRAIKKHGPCDVHRLTFLGKRPKINK
ncbi:MAG: ribonuclease HII [Minisyncoccia bacterium]